MKLINLYIILSLFLFSCIESGERTTLKILDDWGYREIYYPSNYSLKNYCADTLKEYNILSKRYVIFSYADSMGCISCKLSLNKWAELIPTLDSLGVPCLFVFNPKREDIKNLKGYLKHNHFSYPVFIDEADSFNKLNHFPSDERFQTFLLDKDNRVLAVGNPIHNPKVKELYLKIIRGETASREEETPRAQTTVEADRTEADMGRFDWREEQTAEFVLKNTGRHPLVIFDTYASCGCTRVEYDGKPARPGDSLVLRVTYKADSPGHFRKEVTVRCNAEDEQLKLTVTGEAEEKQIITKKISSRLLL